VRSEACEGCTHLSASEKHENEKRSERKFITLIAPELDEACNDALALAEAGKVAQAEERINELHKQHPEYHMVQYGMGVCCVLKNQFEEGAKFFKRAIEIFPVFTEAHFNLGMASQKMLDLPGMAASFREVVRIGENHELVSEAKRRIEDLEMLSRKKCGLSLDAYLKNGDIFAKAFRALEDRKYESAVELFRRILATDPRSVQSWGNLGLSYAGLGMKANALECLDKALELDPRYELAIVNKAVVEDMKEGETITEDIESVDYYREYGRMTGKSYIAEVLNKDTGA
jgi:tetratricopeptide (TPR) repeat protein